MGVLSDLILATEAELASVPPDAVPINVLPGLDVKGIDLVKIGTLHALLAGRDFDPSLQGFPMVSGEESEDGPWVFRCPDDLITRLAAVSDTDVPRVATRWAATEEFRLDGWDPGEVAVAFRKMRDFARRAKDEGKPIHLWT